MKNSLVSISFFLFLFSCSPGNNGFKENFEKSLPIYYNKPLSVSYSKLQGEINKNLELLQKERGSGDDNIQVLGSWFGKNNEGWINITFCYVNTNNMIKGFIINDTTFKSFTGWISTSDNINFKAGITDEAVGKMNYYNLDISLEKMKITGNYSVVSSTGNNIESSNNLLSLTKRNFDYKSNTGQYPEFSQRVIEESEFEELAKEDLKFIYKEVLARHGFIFFDENSSKHFSATDWYVPRNYKVSHLLTEIEKENLEKIYQLF